jgi:hypothetical protein
MHVGLARALLFHPCCCAKSGLPKRQVLVIESGDFCDSGRQHGRLQFGTDMRVSVFHTERATTSQTPQHPTTNVDTRRVHPFIVSFDASPASAHCRTRPQGASS